MPGRPPRPGRRRRARLLAAATLALGVRLLLTTPAAAWNPARDEAVEALAGTLRAAGRLDAGGDYTAIRAAWAGAGLDLRRVDRMLAGAQPSSPARAFFEAACDGGGGLDLARERPRPGDLALAPGPAPAGWRLAMFVGAEELIGADPAGARLVEMPRQAFLGDDGAGGRSGPLGFAGAACRIDAALLPGGTDPDSRPPGRVALLDPGLAADRIDWAAEHPRDAATGLGHAVTGALGAAARALSRGLALVIDGGLQAGAWLLGRSGAAGAPVLIGATLAAGLLGARFDGRRLHSALTAALLAGAALLVLGPGVALLAALAVAGGLGAASALDVPVLGGAAAGAWSVAGFVTTVLTGVEDSDRARVGEVVLAVLADALVWARPVQLGFRAAELGGRWGAVLGRTVSSLASRLGPGLSAARSTAAAAGGGLGAVGTAADAVMLRPHALARGVETLLTLVRGSRPAAAVPAAPLSATRALGRLGGTAVDMVSSLTWRSGSLASDLVGHAGSAAGWLRADIAAGGHSWPLASPVLRDIVARVPPARRAAILEVALPQLREFGTLSHLHSGARSLSGLAAGAPLPSVGALSPGPAGPPGAPPIAPRVPHPRPGPPPVPAGGGADGGPAVPTAPADSR